MARDKSRSKKRRQRLVAAEKFRIAQPTESDVGFLVAQGIGVVAADPEIGRAHV